MVGLEEIVHSVEGVDPVVSRTLEPFRLGSRTDARQLSLRLRDLLAVEGVVVDIARARGLMAEILGYPDWAAVLSDLGDAVSLDDEIADGTVVLGRRVRAYWALYPVVGEATVIGRILVALAPTSCERHVVRTRSRRIELSALDAYHPVRIRMLLDQLDVPSEADDEEDLERERLDQAQRMLASSIERVPYDGYAILDRRIRSVGRWARGIVIEPLRIVDAESQALMLADQPVVRPVFRGEHYVHLGRHRFPSPYPGLGIEGCYLVPDERGGILAMPALSTPAEVPVEDCEVDDLAGHLLEHIRGHGMAIAEIFDGADAVPLDPIPSHEVFGAFDRYGRAPYADGLDGLWRLYLRPVAAAALNALSQALSADRGQRRIGVPEFCETRLVTAYLKASHPEARSEIRADLEASNSLPLVQILGTTPTEAETGFFSVDLPADARFWPTLHAGAWLKALGGDGFTAYARQDRDESLAWFAIACLQGRASVRSPIDLAQIAGLVREQACADLRACDGAAALSLCQAAEAAFAHLAAGAGDVGASGLGLEVLHALALAAASRTGEAAAAAERLTARDPRIALWLSALFSAEAEGEGAWRLFRVACARDPEFATRVLDVARKGCPEDAVDPDRGCPALHALEPALELYADVVMAGFERLRTEPRSSSSVH